MIGNQAVAWKAGKRERNGERTRRDGRGHERDLREDVEGVAGQRQCQGEARGFELHRQVKYREHAPSPGVARLARRGTARGEITALGERWIDPSSGDDCRLIVEINCQH